MSAVIGFYQRTLNEAVVRPYWALRMWAAFHPRSSRVLSCALLITYLVAYPVAAHAVTVQNPLVPSGLEDSTGIDLRNYASLPIDTGGITDPIKAGVSMLAGLLWGVHLALTSWMLWLVDWLLRFEWVDLIATPFQSMADILQDFLVMVGWLPLAMTAAGAVGGMLIMFGKWGKGWQEILMSAICVLLATGFLANPVSALRGADGGFEKAKTWGGELSALVVSEDINEGVAVDDPAHKVSSVITGQIADISIRIPAQTISFGSTLTGECDEIFTEKMIDEPPAVEENALKDAIRDCDEDAKEFSEAINWMAPLTTGVMIVGSIAMFALPIALAVLLMTSVIGTLLAACKSMLYAYVMVFPVSRYPLWRSVMDTLTGLLGIVVTTVLLAGALRVVADAVTGLIDIGVPMVMSSIVSAGLVVVIIVFLTRAKDNTTKMGAGFAQMLSRFGANGSSSSGPVRSMSSALSVGAAMYGVKKLAPATGRMIKGAAGTAGNLAHRTHQFATNSRRNLHGTIANAPTAKMPPNAGGGPTPPNTGPQRPDGPSTTPQGPAGGPSPQTPRTPLTPPAPAVNPVAHTTEQQRPVEHHQRSRQVPETAVLGQHMPPAAPAASTRPVPPPVPSPDGEPAGRAPAPGGDRMPSTVSPPREPSRADEVEVRHYVDMNASTPGPKVTHRRIQVDSSGRGSVRPTDRTVVHHYADLTQARRRRSRRSADMHKMLAEYRR